MTTEFDEKPKESLQDKIARHIAEHPPKKIVVRQVGPRDEPEVPPKSIFSNWRGRQAGIERSQTTADKD